MSVRDEQGDFICVVCGFRVEEWDNPCPKCEYRDSIMPLKLYPEHTKRPRPFKETKYPYSEDLGAIVPYLNGVITEEGFVRTDNPVPDNRVTNGIRWEFI